MRLMEKVEYPVSTKYGILKASGRRPVGFIALKEHNDRWLGGGRVRNEREVIDQLLNFAQADDKVRAVIFNGSRVNPNVRKDIFCDYDVVFGVTDPEYFLENQGWIRYFGDLIIMQQNDLSEAGVRWYIFLMLFTDGVRIDLSFHPIGRMDIQLEDSLKVVLLDKDNIIGQTEPPSENGYYVKQPDKKEFDKVTNEFWWCLTNVAKGLWREELCYAKYMYEAIVRGCMLKMVSWYIGVQHNWCVNPGKFGKWFEDYLPPELWESLKKTYAGPDYGEMWDSIFEAGRLFRKVGLEVAWALGLNYPLEDDKRVTGYLEAVRRLPKDSDDFCPV